MRGERRETSPPPRPHTSTGIRSDRSMDGLRIDTRDERSRDEHGSSNKHHHRREFGDPSAYHSSRSRSRSPSSSSDGGVSEDGFMRELHPDKHVKHFSELHGWEGRKNSDDVRESETEDNFLAILSNEEEERLHDVIIRESPIYDPPASMWVNPTLDKVHPSVDRTTTTSSPRNYTGIATTSSHHNDLSHHNARGYPSRSGAVSRIGRYSEVDIDVDMVHSVVEYDGSYPKRQDNSMISHSHSLPQSSFEKAVVMIQKRFRGYLARKRRIQGESGLIEQLHDVTRSNFMPANANTHKEVVDATMGLTINSVFLLFR